MSSIAYLKPFLTNMEKVTFSPSLIDFLSFREYRARASVLRTSTVRTALCRASVPSILERQTHNSTFLANRCTYPSKTACVPDIYTYNQASLSTSICPCYMKEIVCHEMYIFIHLSHFAKPKSSCT